MKDFVNWAIIAPGNIAEKMGEAMFVTSQKNSSIKCYAVASRNLEKAKKFCDKWNFKKAYGNYDELYCDKNVDAVYIASPHAFHFEMIKNCLKNGKHVLCEKPATVNSAMLNEVIALAVEKKLFFMEALWTAFNPTFNKVLETIKNGVIGNVLNVRSFFCNKNEYDFEGRNFNPHLAGGALLDLGIYNLFFSMAVSNAQNLLLKKPTNILDIPQKINSTCRIVNTVDAWNSVNMRFENGVNATFESGMDIPTIFESHDAYIFGEKGYIFLPNFFMAQNAKIFVYNPKIANKAELFETVNFPFEINGYEYEMIEATNCILEQKTESFIYPHSCSQKLCAIMDNLRKDWGIKYPFE